MNKLFFVSLFTLGSMLAFEEQKQIMLTKLYPVHRHQLMPIHKHKKFMGNYLKDAYRMLKCMQFSVHNLLAPESQQYFDALTDYISENCMYEMVLRKSQRFFRLRNNKLADTVVALRNAIEAIGKVSLIPFDVEQEFIKTKNWFNQANTEYFKRIGLKK